MQYVRSARHNERSYSVGDLTVSKLSISSAPKFLSKVNKGQVLSKFPFVDKCIQ